MPSVLAPKVVEQGEEYKVAMLGGAATSLHYKSKGVPNANSFHQHTRHSIIERRASCTGIQYACWLLW
jgi:hypothetical protein